MKYVVLMAIKKLEGDMLKVQQARYILEAGDRGEAKAMAKGRLRLDYPGYEIQGEPSIIGREEV